VAQSFIKRTHINISLAQYSDNFVIASINVAQGWFMGYTNNNKKLVLFFIEMKTLIEEQEYFAKLNIKLNIRKIN
jgi:hypothetical protein